MKIKEFIDKVNEKIDSQLAWCGGDRNQSSEMKNWRKAYSDVKIWMKELSKEINQLDDENLNDNKTPIDWIFDQLEFDKAVSMDNIEEIFKQANKMYNQNIIKAIRENEIELKGYYMEGTSERYYNETFKSE